MAKRGKPTEPVRVDWHVNHEAIKKAFFDLLADEKREGKPPTAQEIGDKVGLNRNAVASHLKQMKIGAKVNPARLLKDSVLMGLAKAAMEGNPASVKLYFQLLFGWSEGDEAKGARTVLPPLMIEHGTTGGEPDGSDEASE